MVESAFTKEELHIIESMVNCAIHKIVFNNPMYREMATGEQLGSILEKIRKIST